MSAKFAKTLLSTQTIPQGYVFSLGSKIPRQVFTQYHKGMYLHQAAKAVLQQMQNFTKYSQ